MQPLQLLHLPLALSLSYATTHTFTSLLPLSRHAETTTSIKPSRHAQTTTSIKPLQASFTTSTCPNNYTNNSVLHALNPTSPLQARYCTYHFHIAVLYTKLIAVLYTILKLLCLQYLCCTMPSLQLLHLPLALPLSYATTPSQPLHTSMLSLHTYTFTSLLPLSRHAQTTTSIKPLQASSTTSTCPNNYTNNSVLHALNPTSLLQLPHMLSLQLLHLPLALSLSYAATPS